VPAAVTSRHLPSAWLLPSAEIVHCWALVPAQSNSWISVPLAVDAARHVDALVAEPVPLVAYPHRQTKQGVSVEVNPASGRCSRARSPRP